MQSVDRLAIFERLKHSVQLLACPPEIQLKMLPRFVGKADELALDFDLWREVVLNNFRSEPAIDGFTQVLHRVIGVVGSQLSRQNTLSLTN